MQWLALTAITVAAVGADQLTKYVVTSHLRLDDGLHVAGPFWIHHVRNSGIAFGLLAGAAPVVVVLTGAAVASMLVYFARSGARHPVLPIALGLVIGGSVSNLLDRIRLGYLSADFRAHAAAVQNDARRDSVTRRAGFSVATVAGADMVEPFV